MTSNVGQNYPYTSETEVDRGGGDRAPGLGAREGLAATISTDAPTPLDEKRALVGLEMPDVGLPGSPPCRRLFGEKHAVFVVCDGTCGKTYLR